MRGPGEGGGGDWRGGACGALQRWRSTRETSWPSQVTSYPSRRIPPASPQEVCRGGATAGRGRLNFARESACSEIVVQKKKDMLGSFVRVSVCVFLLALAIRVVVSRAPTDCITAV